MNIIYAFEILVIISAIGFFLLWAVIEIKKRYFDPPADQKPRAGTPPNSKPDNSR